MKTFDDTTEASVSETPVEDRDIDESGKRRWWRQWWHWAAAVVVVALAALAGLVWLFTTLTGGNGEEAATPNTAAVRSTDLVAMTSLNGVLGYGEGEQIAFRSSNDGVDTLPGGLSGVVTEEPTVGDYYEEGAVIYEVNNEPVVLLYGSIPAYRTLSTRSSDGADVEQLERALVNLGYANDSTLTVDENFTSATRDAVELLQADIGANETGVLGLGEYAFVPGPLYVAESFVSLAQTTQSGQAVVATSAVMGTTVTWVADEGEIIGQGDRLYTVDERPVVLVLGDVPAYRAMAFGDEGADVAAIQRALVDLGYADAGSVVDGVFDEETLVAMLVWQAAIGAHTDGVVNLGEVVFVTEPVRIGSVLVTPGDTMQNGAPVVATSASFTFVTVQLPTADQDLVAVGDAVIVELPDGETAAATVTAIGTVAQAGQQAGDNFFEVTVTLDDPAAALGLDGAPVDVEVVNDSAIDVLAVPVTALLALSEGGYAVEVVVEDGSRLLIGVEPGLFSDGFVEVAGNGLVDGMQVVVP